MFGKTYKYIVKLIFSVFPFQNACFVSINVGKLLSYVVNVESVFIFMICLGEEYFLLMRCQLSSLLVDILVPFYINYSKYNC